MPRIAALTLAQVPTSSHPLVGPLATTGLHRPLLSDSTRVSGLVLLCAARRGSLEHWAQLLRSLHSAPVGDLRRVNEASPDWPRLEPSWRCPGPPAYPCSSSGTWRLVYQSSALCTSSPRSSEQLLQDSTASWAVPLEPLLPTCVQVHTQHGVILPHGGVSP